MESTLVSRSELVGKIQSKTAVLESLVRANVLNRTGNVDYNQYGKLDGVGFEKVTAKFVDNFIFANLVPDYNTKKDKGNKLKNIFFLRKIRLLEICFLHMELKNLMLKQLV